MTVYWVDCYPARPTSPSLRSTTVAVGDRTITITDLHKPLPGRRRTLPRRSGLVCADPTVAWATYADQQRRALDAARAAVTVAEKCLEKALDHDTNERNG